MAVGIEGVRFDVQVHAGESGARNFLLHTRRAAAIDQHIGMVYGPHVSRADLDGLYPARAGHLQRQHEIPVLVGSARGQTIRFRSFNYQVRLAKLPAGNELRQRRRIRR